MSKSRGVPEKLICPTCGKEFILSKWQRWYYKKNPSCKLHCSKECYNKDKVGKGNPKWRGGKTITKGYVYIYCPEHPYATHDGYVCEHRLIMEKHIGRYLRPTESVHHINGDTLDNRIENLLLITNESEHRRLHAKYRTRNQLGQFDGHKKPLILFKERMWYLCRSSQYVWTPATSMVAKTGITVGLLDM